tara:strand:- start:4039 stop:5637 length:1599 start_codon:yes stop_codon:yes gene_type:complete
MTFGHAALLKLLLTFSWRFPVLAFLAGLFSATALPPWSFPLGVFGFSVLFLLIYRTKTIKKGVLIVWVFSFGYHLFGLQWISNALLIDSEQFAWLMPFSLMGIPALLAIIPSLIIPILCKILLPPFWFPILASTLWTLSEYLRGHLFTGFPWNLPAYMLTFSDSILQTASLVGVYGLSWLLMLFTAGSTLLFTRELWNLPFYRVFMTLLVLVPLALWSYGTNRLNKNPTGLNSNYIIRLVQGNIPQKEKWAPQFRLRNIEKYIALSKIEDAQHSQKSISKKPNLVIWPETAIPALIANDDKLRNWIGHFLKRDMHLITGAPSLSKTNTNQPLNSVFVLTAEGHITHRYDKAHLVPFGEYVPFRGWLPFPKLVTKFPDFKAGPGLTSIKLPTVGYISPLVCFEIIFPGNVMMADPSKRPNLLINLTNDAWFGKSAGPHQHLQHARLRAIEEGIPLIRVANTGISATFDPLGRKLSEIALGEAGYVDQNLIKPLGSKTLYTKIGDSIYLLITALILFVTVLGKLFFNSRSFKIY